jgi:hypothetical protein
MFTDHHDQSSRWGGRHRSRVFGAINALRRATDFNALAMRPGRAVAASAGSFLTALVVLGVVLSVGDMALVVFAGGARNSPTWIGALIRAPLWEFWAGPAAWMLLDVGAKLGMAVIARRAGIPAVGPVFGPIRTRLHVAYPDDLSAVVFSRIVLAQPVGLILAAGVLVAVHTFTGVRIFTDLALVGLLWSAGILMSGTLICSVLLWLGPTARRVRVLGQLSLRGRLVLISAHVTLLGAVVCAGLSILGYL